VLEQQADGVVCPVGVTHFDTQELVEMDTLLQGHAVHQILQPLQDLGLPVPDFVDPMVRVRMEREILPLLRCYGVEGFAQRALNTTRYLQHMTRQARQLRVQHPTPSNAAHVARLAGKVTSLTVQLAQQRERFQATIRELKTEHAKTQSTPGSSSVSGTAVSSLQSEVARLQTTLQGLTQERDQQKQDARLWHREAESAREEFAVHRRQLDSSRVFSATELMNFLMDRVAFSGYWPRLLELLEDYQHGRPPVSGRRTSMSISARDLASDDCAEFTPLEEKAPAPSGIPSSPPPLSSGQAAQALSSLAQGSSNPSVSSSLAPSPASTSSAPSGSGTISGAPGKKSSRVLLPASLVPSGVKKSGSKGFGRQLSRLQTKGSTQPLAGKAPPGSVSSPVVDLTQTSPSGSASSVAKSHKERIALARRPRVYTSAHVRALPKSPSTKSEADVVLHMPDSMDRADIRADLWELLRAGRDFWDAVAELQEAKVKHDLFGKRALVRMLISMIYWEQLDNTPWSSFVPEVYYDAAVKKIRDPVNSSVPAPWQPLPQQPATSDAESSLDYFASDFDDEDEDSDDEDFLGKVSNTKSPVQTRSQKSQPGRSSVGGKRPRGSSPSTGDPSSKRSRQQSGSTFFDIIEVPQAGRVSWTHYGIKVQRVNDQTIGFPKYTACRNGIAALHARWDPFAYLDLLESEPWDVMWEGRIQTLVFFRRSELSDDLLRGIQMVIGFMFVWRQHYWERLHWVTMTVDFDFEADPRFAKLSQDQRKTLRGLYKDRKARASDFATKKRALVVELEKISDYRSDIWYEPGLWVVPAATCDWILHSPRAQMSLPDQLEELDANEPSRTQWATRRSENAFLNIVPQHVLAKLMGDNERAANPLPELGDDE
jgi:hypothetical protein